MGIPDDAGVEDPEVVADFVSYICKPSSRFITGQLGYRAILRAITDAIFEFIQARPLA